MKKLLISFLAITLMLGGGVALAYNDDGHVNIKESSGGSAANAVRVYTLVRNPNADPNGVSFSRGDVLLWDVESDDGVTVNELNKGSQSADAVAGVVVSATIPTQDGMGPLTSDTSVGLRNWGYIQTYGVNDTTKIRATLITNPGAGSPICADKVTSRYGSSCVVDGGVGARQGGCSMPFGFAYDAETTENNSAEVFIKNR